LSIHSSEAPQGIDLSRPLFICTNANQAATCINNTHTSNQFREKRKRKEMKEKLKQVIKSQTKAKMREKNFGPLRQGQRLDTTEIKCSKIVDSSK
jgi:hypothetical protein